MAKLCHPTGAFNLGLLLESQGDHAGARIAYERGDRLGSPEAAINLADIYVKEGKMDAARAAYQRAEERGHKDAAFFTQDC